MPKSPLTKAAIAVGAVAAATAIGAAVAKKRGLNLRGWALYNFAKLIAPNISDPAVLRKMISQDRANGPALPPKGLLKKIDFHESAGNGMRIFHARRKGAPETSLKLLYLHGGAYVLDFQAIQWNLVAGLLERVDGEVVAPIYPLAPEAGWRQTMAAVRAHYLALVEANGAENIIVFGDSAGGGIALLLAQALRDAGEPQPRALVLFSPCLDLSGSGADQPALEKRDPALSLRLVETIAPMWAKDLPANDPRVSPLFGEHHDLPPTMIFSGDREILDSDALRLKAINPSVDHRHYAEMMHVWPVSPIREGRQALDEAAAFIRRNSA
ncbi:alpha/beta hydrolase [Sphingobium yanoikuyae]|uniref:alpha/beta hydrolase n=1 Tax=Sphingobium yanoikuyae TaxID=13690 RepID=UPI000F85ADB6